MELVTTLREFFPWIKRPKREKFLQHSISNRHHHHHQQQQQQQQQPGASVQYGLGLTHNPPVLSMFGLFSPTSDAHPPDVLLHVSYTASSGRPGFFLP
jgi:hypothetical protein